MLRHILTVKKVIYLSERNLWTKEKKALVLYFWNKSYKYDANQANEGHTGYRGWYRWEDNINKDHVQTVLKTKLQQN